VDVSAFAELHRPGEPLLMPNAWDIGSARILAGLGFEALATTSSGFAATLGRLDGSVGRDEVLAHARELAAATPLPVSADLEDGYGDDEAGVAETVRLAIDAGLAGCSIEDWSGDAIYPADVAAARVAAASEAAGDGFVLTGRAENLIHGVDDLGDTIDRLRAYEAAGADVLYAPGLVRIEDVRAVVDAVSRPVNVLMRPNSPTVGELAEAGVARISVGGAFAFAAIGALVEAARELREQGTTGYFARTATGLEAVRATFD
jgi:2-methylisocitrate lyase-like PEP mutase family enzyme